MGIIQKEKEKNDRERRWTPFVWGGVGGLVTAAGCVGICFIAKGHLNIEDIAKGIGVLIPGVPMIGINTLLDNRARKIELDRLEKIVEAITVGLKYLGKEQGEEVESVVWNWYSKLPGKNKIPDVNEGEIAERNKKIFDTCESIVERRFLRKEKIALGEGRVIVLLMELLDKESERKEKENFLWGGQKEVETTTFEEKRKVAKRLLRIISDVGETERTDQYEDEFIREGKELGVLDEMVEEAKANGNGDLERKLTKFQEETKKVPAYTGEERPGDTVKQEPESLDH